MLLRARCAGSNGRSALRRGNSDVESFSLTVRQGYRRSIRGGLFLLQPRFRDQLEVSPVKLVPARKVAWASQTRKL